MQFNKDEVSREKEEILTSGLEYILLKSIEI